MSDASGTRIRPLLYTGLAFYGGFCSMGLEMTAARLLAPYFGTSNYIWTNVIGIILLALSLGYWLGGILADRRPNPKTLAACLLAGGLAGLPIPFVIRPLAEALLPAGMTLDNAFLVIFKGSFLGALLFAPAVTILGMVSPFVIRILADETGNIGRSTGRVFAVSTIGSILGIFSSTLFLVPWLGSRTTVLVFSTMLVAIALVMLLSPSRAAAAALLLVVPFVAMRGATFKDVRWEASAAGVSSADASADTLDPNAPAPKRTEWESGYQYVRVVRENGTRYLKLNEGLDSFHSLTVEGDVLTNAYYDYYNAFPLLFLDRDRLDVAILGGGGGTSVRQYDHFFGDRFDLHIDSVEIDPLVTEIGRRYFGYPEKGVTVHDLDARVFVNLASGDYDIIIVDAYANQVYIPFHVATREFFEHVRRLLGDEGIVAMNVGAFEPDAPLVAALVATLRSVFPDTYAMTLPRSRNLIVYASVGIDSFEPMLDAASGTGLESIAASVVYASRPASEWFADDSARVLTDTHAPVEWLTDQMVWRRAREVTR